MDIRNMPKIVWAAILVGLYSLSISINEIFEGVFQYTDIATIFDTALGIFSLTLFFRNYFTYFIYVTLIALKVIAGFALSITFFVISGLGDFLNSTATLWIAGLTIFWLGFYVALRRPNVKEWYRAGSNNKPQPSAQSAG